MSHGESPEPSAEEAALQKAGRHRAQLAFRGPTSGWIRLQSHNLTANAPLALAWLSVRDNGSCVMLHANEAFSCSPLLCDVLQRTEPTLVLFLYIIRTLVSQVGERACVCVCVCVLVR